MSPSPARKRLAFVAVAACVCLTLPAAGSTTGARAASKGTMPTRWSDTGPAPGVYLADYGPSFYVGFAPRVHDPKRLHIELARGNQLRVTAVLGDAEIESYAHELLVRLRTIKELLARGVIDLAQNRPFVEFEEQLRAADVEGLVASRKALTPDDYRAKNLALLEKLNPRRVFRIRIPVDGMIKRWKAELAALSDEQWKVAKTRLAAANRALPGRLVLVALDAEDEALLAAAWSAARWSLAGTSESIGPDAFPAAGRAFLTRVAGQRYQIGETVVEAVELTAIYPAGTINRTVAYKGRQVPAFGVTGVWPLIPRRHGRGNLGSVDYISPNPGYGYLPNLGYEYGGGIEYNSIHNAALRWPLSMGKILPEAWRTPPASPEKEPRYRYLWLASRGPVSHGCTRLPSGHLAELRSILPADPKALQSLPTYRNLPQCYDVYDIDGDGDEEVMGVKYYLAFSATEDRRPKDAWAMNERRPFYEWLYGDDLVELTETTARLRNVVTCAFVAKAAVEQAPQPELPLYEAEYAPERLQFYRLRKAAIEGSRGQYFQQELTRISAGYEADANKLFLEK